MLCRNIDHNLDKKSHFKIQNTKPPMQVGFIMKSKFMN